MPTSIECWFKWAGMNGRGRRSGDLEREDVKPRIVPLFEAVVKGRVAGRVKSRMELGAS